MYAYGKEFKINVQLINKEDSTIIESSIVNDFEETNLKLNEYWRKMSEEQCTCIEYLMKTPDGLQKNLFENFIYEKGETPEIVDFLTDLDLLYSDDYSPDLDEIILKDILETITYDIQIVNSTSPFETIKSKQIKGLDLANKVVREFWEIIEDDQSMVVKFLYRSPNGLWRPIIDYWDLTDGEIIEKPWLYRALRERVETKPMFRSFKIKDITVIDANRKEKHPKTGIDYCITKKDFVDGDYVEDIGCSFDDYPFNEYKQTSITSPDTFNRIYKPDNKPILNHNVKIGSEEYYYVCSKCMRPYEKCTCLEPPTALISIDSHMYEPIKILNEKGYRTSFCCSGHNLEKEEREEYAECEAYISFSVTMDTHMSLPARWFFEGDHIIRYEYESTTMEKFFIERNKMSKELADWATSLPINPYAIFVNSEMDL